MCFEQIMLPFFVEYYQFSISVCCSSIRHFFLIIRVYKDIGERCEWILLPFMNGKVTPWNLWSVPVSPYISLWRVWLLKDLMGKRTNLIFGYVYITRFNELPEEYSFKYYLLFFHNSYTKIMCKLISSLNEIKTVFIPNWTIIF